MIELHEVGLVEGLPPDVAKEPWVQILDAVFRERRKKELEAAERLKIYTDIDRADEAVLDILAVQFRVDWYDTSYPIETKRRIIKTALEVRRYCGTEWAVQKALASIYPNVKISEWYDYGGRPGYWRMNVDITDDGVIYYTPEKLKSALVMPGAVPLTLNTSSTSSNRMNGRLPTSPPRPAEWLPFAPSGCPETSSPAPSRLVAMLPVL